VHPDRAGVPNPAYVAGFTAGGWINMRDYSNSTAGKTRQLIKRGAILKQNLYGFSYNIQARRHLEAKFV